MNHTILTVLGGIGSIWIVAMIFSGRLPVRIRRIVTNRIGLAAACTTIVIAYVSGHR